jgi:hypothetical protein
VLRPNPWVASSSASAASRSAHYRLKLTLTSSTGETLSKIAEIDVQGPRDEYNGHTKSGTFYENEAKSGCT